MAAVLQFEINIDRFLDPANFHVAKYASETPWDRLFAMAKTAACDTIQNGGTFVLVRDGNTLTMVQRPEAEKL